MRHEKETVEHTLAIGLAAMFLGVVFLAPCLALLHPKHIDKLRHQVEDSSLFCTVEFSTRCWPRQDSYPSFLLIPTIKFGTIVQLTGIVHHLTNGLVCIS